MIAVELTQDELDNLANTADGFMENWLDLRDSTTLGTRAWDSAHEHYQFWLNLAIKLGCKYENT